MSLQKLMLVDDEYIIIEGLKKLIPCEELDLEIVHTAENAEQALDYLAENEVDIIITDISMPEMTGLEMIAKMRDLSPKTDYIVLSGYQEFDYARQAISLGVVDYLVKPVNRTAITERLKELSQRRNNDWAWAEKVLRGDFSGVTTEKIKQYQSSPLFLSANLVEVEGAVCQVSSEVLSQTVYLALWEQEPLAQNFLVSQPFAFDKEDFIAFKEKVERKLFYANQVDFSEENKEDAYQILREKIATGNFSDFLTALTEMTPVLEKQSLPVYLSRQMFVQIMTEVYLYFNKFDFSQFRIVVDKINACVSLEEILNYVKEQVSELFQTHTYSPHVSEVLRIVGQDYQQELTLKTMSDQLFLNTVYLGQIIKKETGHTFSELLNRQRIKVAQQLLITTDESVEEICFKVGYNNVGYFYKIFKRLCNDSPKLYREQLGMINKF